MSVKPRGAGARAWWTRPTASPTRSSTHGPGSKRTPDPAFFLFLHTYEVHHPYSPERADLESSEATTTGPCRTESPWTSSTRSIGQAPWSCATASIWTPTIEIDRGPRLRDLRDPAPSCGSTTPPLGGLRPREDSASGARMALPHSLRRAAARAPAREAARSQAGGRLVEGVAGSTRRRSLAPWAGAASSFRAVRPGHPRLRKRPKSGAAATPPLPTRSLPCARLTEADRPARLYALSTTPCKARPRPASNPGDHRITSRRLCALTMPRFASIRPISRSCVRVWPWLLG